MSTRRGRRASTGGARAAVQSGCKGAYSCTGHARSRPLHSPRARRSSRSQHRRGGDEAGADAVLRDRRGRDAAH
eukprot:4562411-Heterocapsa_arctica.AAC.1